MSVIVSMIVYLAPVGEAKYCDDRVCLSVCLSVREHISGTTRPIFTNFYARYLCPWLGPPLEAYVMYFPFMDDFIFA